MRPPARRRARSRTARRGRSRRLGRRTGLRSSRCPRSSRPQIAPSRRATSTDYNAAAIPGWEGENRAAAATCASTGTTVTGTSIRRRTPATRRRCRTIARNRERSARFPTPRPAENAVHPAQTMRLRSTPAPVAARTGRPSFPSAAAATRCRPPRPARNRSNTSQTNLTTASPARLTTPRFEPSSQGTGNGRAIRPRRTPQSLLTGCAREKTTATPRPRGSRHSWPQNRSGIFRSTSWLHTIRGAAAGQVAAKGWLTAGPGAGFRPFADQMRDARVGE